MREDLLRVILERGEGVGGEPWWDQRPRGAAGLPRGSDGEALAGPAPHVGLLDERRCKRGGVHGYLHILKMFSAAAPVTQLECCLDTMPTGGADAAGFASKE